MMHGCNIKGSAIKLVACQNVDTRKEVPVSVVQKLEGARAIAADVPKAEAVRPVRLVVGVPIAARVEAGRARQVGTATTVAETQAYEMSNQVLALWGAIWVFVALSGTTVELASPFAQQTGLEPVTESLLVHDLTKLDHSLRLLKRPAGRGGLADLLRIRLPDALEVLVPEVLDRTDPRRERDGVLALAVHQAGRPSVAHEHEGHVEVRGGLLDALELLAAGDVVGPDERGEDASGRDHDQSDMSRPALQQVVWGLFTFGCE